MSALNRQTAGGEGVEVDELRRQAKLSSRMQRLLFPALTVNADLVRMPLVIRDPVPFRKFESNCVWVVRGQEHMEHDISRFVSAVGTGKVGYLTAATGLGKSTSMLCKVVRMSGAKVVSLLPDDKLAYLTALYTASVEHAKVDGVQVSYLRFGKLADVTTTQLTYMSVSTFLVLLAVNENWLDVMEVKLVYVDEAHFESVEYDVLRTLAMVGVLGRRTVCFATATPPGMSSNESYRRVQPVVESFPVVEPTMNLQLDAADFPFAHNKLKGSVLVFAVSNDHAARLHQYYQENDIDSSLLTSETSTEESFRLSEKFVKEPRGTRVVVTTVLWEYGHTVWIDCVIDFGVTLKVVQSGPGQPFLLKARPVPEAVRVQRAGRAGRMGDMATIYRMDRIPNKNDGASVANDIRRYCWLQLFNVVSNSESYKITAELVGELSPQKCWYLLTTSIHPLLLLKYMDEVGCIKAPFVEALKPFFPAGVKLDRSAASYEDATASFLKYVRPVDGRGFRVPLGVDNYFIDDMVYVDTIASRGMSLPDVAESVYGGGSVFRVNDKSSGFRYQLKGLHEKICASGLVDQGSGVLDTVIEREEAKASLEGYEGDEIPSSPMHKEVDYSALVVASSSPGLAFHNDQVVRRNRPVTEADWFTDKPDPLGNLGRGTVGTLAVRPAVVVQPPRRSNHVAVSATETIVRGSDTSSVTVQPPKFHPAYADVTYANSYVPATVPKMVARSRTPTFTQMYEPVVSTECDGRMLFPYADVAAHPDRYTRPTPDEVTAVKDMIQGNLRISEMSRIGRERNYTSLLKVWNSTVVDGVQFEGRDEKLRSRERPSESRVLPGESLTGRRHKSVVVVVGKRFDFDGLTRLLSAFEHYGLSPCVPMMMARKTVEGHIATVDELRAAMLKIQLSKLTSMKEPSVNVNWNELMDRSKGQALSELSVDCENFVATEILDRIVCVHLPNVIEMHKFGFRLSQGYAWGSGMKVLAHTLGISGPSNDVVHVELKRGLTGVGVPNVRVPLIGETLFVVVGDAEVVPSFVVRHGGFKFGLVGPMKLRECDFANGVYVCDGYSKMGMSGSPVVSGVTGELVGLLWGKFRDRQGIAVSKL